jgi:serine protease Do
LIGFANSAKAQTADDEFESAIARVVEQSSPSIVAVETIGGSGVVNGIRKTSGPGTGVILDPVGWIVTADYHLANKPSSIVIRTHFGKRLPASVVARDRARKLALLKVEFDDGEPSPAILPTISSEELNVGQTVIAAGRGFDIDSVQISTGIISAKDRIWGTALQTDAKVSPANYGGPLLDLTGRLTGILVPMSPSDSKPMAGTEWYDSGIGFAVPIEQIQNRLALLKDGMDQQAGKLGISFVGSDVYSDAPTVAFCLGNSPAGKAGIRAGDTITAVNGARVRRQAEFRHSIGPMYAGDEIQISVTRNGNTVDLSTKLVAKLPAYLPVGIGAAVRSSSAKNNKGNELVVRQIEAKSPADQAGLKTGDLVTTALDQPVKTINDLKIAIASKTIGSKIKLTVLRDGEPIDIECAVAARNASIPAELESDGTKEAPTSGELKLVDTANPTLFITPADKGSPKPLLVWLAPAGGFDVKEIKKRWQSACNKNGVNLLAIGSSKAKQWSPQEASVILQTINTYAKQTKIDVTRIVIGGRGNGGTMASLIGFSTAKKFQGLILDDAEFSNQITEISPDPVSPMMVLSTDATDSAKSLTPVRETKTPLLVVPAIDAEAAARWIGFVDRL